MQEIGKMRYHNLPRLLRDLDRMTARLLRQAHDETLTPMICRDLDLALDAERCLGNAMPFREVTGIVERRLLAPRSTHALFQLTKHKLIRILNPPGVALRLRPIRAA